MKLRLFFFLALGATIIISGCKKSEEDTSNPSLTGLTLESNATSFVKVGTTVTITPDVSSLTTSDSSTPEKIGIYWQVNTASKDTLSRDIKASLPQYVYKADTAGTYTIFCYAFATNYYNSSTSVTFQAIDPATSLTGLAGERTTKLDGKDFHTFEVGGKTWLGENFYSSGYSYQDSDVMDSLLGNYYTWEEALTVCPVGWHLPTGAEFDALGSKAGELMADAYLLSVKLWNYWPGMTITNALGFNAIPAGYKDLTQPSSPDNGYREYALWWTADEVNEQMASFRFIYEDNPVIQQGQGSKSSLALSVRCVKD